LDSNQRPPAPKAGALAKLSYTPEIAVLLPDVYFSMPFRKKQITNIKKLFYTKCPNIATNSYLVRGFCDYFQEIGLKHFRLKNCLHIYSRQYIILEAILWGEQEAAPGNRTGIKIMKSGTEKRWLLSVFSVLCVFFIGSKLSPSETAQAELQTGTDSGIVVIPVQNEHDSFGPCDGQYGWLNIMDI
jgi:hypothetical protein